MRPARLAALVCWLGATIALCTACQIAASVSPDPIVVTPGQLSATATVQWRDSAPLLPVFIDLCRVPVDQPGFDLARDCDPDHGLREKSSLRGEGSASLELPVRTILAGSGGPGSGEQGSDEQGTGQASGSVATWACAPEGEQVPGAGTVLDECWVRLSWGDRQNPLGQASAPYGFVNDSQEIPETPWVLLPTFLAAGVAGTWLVGRRLLAGR